MSAAVVFTRWNPRVGQENVAIYAPGERCEAFPGSPVFSNTWTAVTWWPGRDEQIKVYGTFDHALAAEKRIGEVSHA